MGKQTKEQLAERLNGNEYGREVQQVDIDTANENKLVIVYGASDDLMEFVGAVNEEFGTEAFFDKNGEEIYRCEDDCVHSQKALEKANKIEADFTRNGWRYKTKIPHVTFDIMEDGELYCRGIIFSLTDLK